MGHANLTLWSVTVGKIRWGRGAGPLIYCIENGTLHNIRYLSFSVVYKCRRIPSYELTSLSSKFDRDYIVHDFLRYCFFTFDEQNFVNFYSEYM